jgi:hypothetical protein
MSCPSGGCIGKILEKNSEFLSALLADVQKISSLAGMSMVYRFSLFVVLFLSLLWDAFGSPFAEGPVIVLSATTTNQSDTFPRLKTAVPKDSNVVYYLPLADQLLVRTYLSRKFTSFTFQNPNRRMSLKYRPNTTINLGIGATWRSLTLNLAYGFPFLNNRNAQGETSYLDLQSHLYTRNWSIDTWGQFYKGYYTKVDPSRAPPPGDQQDRNYVRPDAGITLIGVSAFKLLQPHRFSYRAAFVQNEWQQKSGGTFLVGAEIYYGRVSADSALIPSFQRREFPGNFLPQINRIRLIDVGPGLGYAHTFVYEKKWFVTLAGSFIGNLGYTKSLAENNQVVEKWGFSPNLLYRGTIGYNSRYWSFTANIVGNRISVRGAEKNFNYRLENGNYRFTVSRRLLPGKKVKKVLDKLPGATPSSSNVNTTQTDK